MQPKKNFLAPIFAFGLFWPAPQAPAQELSKLPYVPTPQIVIDEMLKLAKVTARDFVVDLGSGDGRVIISAARTYKASGFGVDIDPKLVELSNQAARDQGVADRTKFFEQDMFKADLSKATVVALYVLPDFMEKLRPKLFAEMKPGTRIVAHDYAMGEWAPDQQLELTVPEKKAANGTDKAYVYLWVVPSVVSGHWCMNFHPGMGQPQGIVLSFNQRYQMLSAAAETIRGPLTIESPTLKADAIDFFVTIGMSHFRFSGRALGDKLEGVAVSANAPKPIPWRANKIGADNKCALR